MIYFTGDRLIDLLRLLNISSEWGKLYNETLDITKEDESVVSDGVPAEVISYQTQYPQFSGWFNARVVRPPTTQKIRIARADKSVSEGYKYDFDWRDLGINTIIGWKYL